MQEDYLSSVINAQIEVLLERGYPTGYEQPFEELLSFGELVDRLTIVNLKLFVLKNDVMRKQEDEKFCAEAAVQDVRLVEERARLKKCLDAKLVAVVKRVAEGDSSGGTNPEVKKYG